MWRWTQSHSVLLSQLLDSVIGTQGEIEITKDFCMIIECNRSVSGDNNFYFTGSKAEGLSLPGSDIDYMVDANAQYHLAVIEQGMAVPQSCPGNLVEMVTENVHPAFAMLRVRGLIHHHDRLCIIHNLLKAADGFYFLSSYLLKLVRLSVCDHGSKIQGPSLEHPKSTPDGTETDLVESIHCSFWPSVASEWAHRTRSHNWPDEEAINKIVDFGFHLVPIGYPHSPRRDMEWRVSFSIAERLLVWSFNHIQMQMYAIIKLILKEFIKVKCRTVNYVLCSYFIKTFLFWKFEETEKNFWRIENFRDCLIYLLDEFYKVIQDGILRHYFIRNFNLLEVKLTREAQLELLQLYDVTLQFGIRIIEKCKSLKQIWTAFLQKINSVGTIQPCVNHRNCFGCNHSKRNFIHITLYMMSMLTYNLCSGDFIIDSYFVKMLVATDALCDTAATLIVQHSLKRDLLMYKVSHHTNKFESNKQCYIFMRSFDKLSVDIATGKLWTSILYLHKGDYKTALCTINHLSSSIPPYALYCSNGHIVSKRDTKMLYLDMFVNSGLDFCQIASKAWLFDFNVPKQTISIMPAAIQMELLHSSDDELQKISPFALIYYLRFLCYHGLRQYDNRDRALRQLLEVVDNPEQYGHISIRYRAYNIAGHCLWFVGMTARARQMFLKSCEVKMLPDEDNENEDNAARHYLRNYVFDIDIDLD